MTIDILGELLLTVAVLGMLWQLYLLLFGLASRRWQRAIGRVAGSRPRERDGVGSRNPGPRGLRYTYSVGGRRFESGRLAYRPVQTTIKKALKEIGGAGESRELDVYYDPRQPRRAVLVPGIAAGNIVGLCAMLAILAVAVAVILLN